VFVSEKTATALIFHGSSEGCVGQVVTYQNTNHKEILDHFLAVDWGWENRLYLK